MHSQITSSFIAASLLVLPLSAQVTVPTYHNDNGRTGLSEKEYALSPASVGSGRFGKRFTRVLDGNVYAQPLYLPAVPVAGKGAHNLILAATAHNSVWALDADGLQDTDAEPLWKINFLDSAKGITSVPAEDVGCAVIHPEIGITGTPVVDPVSLILYAIAQTKEPGPRYVYRLHAIDVKTGLELDNSPVEIQPAGFDPAQQKQRAALLLANGTVYSSWSGICDLGEYQGWVMAHDASTLQLRKTFNDSPDRTGGSFWNGGAGPAADEAGNVYVISANGPFDADSGGPHYGDSFLKLSRDLAVLDYFAPFNRNYLDSNDLDLGSAGAVLLPEAAGTPEHPHLLVSAGKEGRVYLLDRDRMGQAQNGSDSDALASLPMFSHAVFGSVAYFNGSLYIAPEYSPLAAIRISNAAMSEAPVSQAPHPTYELGATPSISSNGSTNGVVWIAPYSNNGALEAYDAADLSRRLFTSSAIDRDALGGWSEFAVPTVADGKVFVGAANALVVYGLLNSQPGEVLAVVNAASYQAGAVSPGSLISVFGAGLAQASAPATDQPLPISLADVSVRVNGTPAPLLYVSPLQINAQMPPDATPGPATLVVTVSGKPTPPVILQLLPAAPGIFTTAEGAAAAIDPSGGTISESHPAPAGSTVSVFLTGIGPSGLPVTATIGGRPATVLFAGPAPGYTGLAQVNLTVPNLPAGAHPLAVSVNDVPSNIATIAVAGQ